ncbi:hypothetical protein ED733_006916 [Metarhizium rileyi]|uniref:Uncharacterized protein n=1 Tax=Metarhizium rileyi (strain RCEF 4871) TaxID=1649241 RepID=A0A5C6GP70_METRR|nr:hypothetical protein ED733_006916 [Metarhizium rileyi]
MTSKKVPKNWVRTTSQDFSPSGALSLGQLMTDPFNPDSCLITTPLPSIPAGGCYEETHKKDVAYRSEFSVRTGFRGWLQDTSGILAAAGVEQDRRGKDCFRIRIEKLLTKIFLPDVDYARKAVEATKYATDKKWWELRPRLYIVTGLRIAEGARSFTNDYTRGHNSGQAAAVGCSANGKSIFDQHEHAAEISPFIVAYRLHEVFWTCRFKPLLTTRPFVRGIIQSAENSTAADEEIGVMEMVGYEIDNVASQAFDGGAFDTELMSE